LRDLRFKDFEMEIFAERERDFLGERLPEREAK